jgi:hypothetical protein
MERLFATRFIQSTQELDAIKGVDMWKYYKYVHIRSKNDPLDGKAYVLFRMKGYHVERYEGLERWIVPPYSGQLKMDLDGMGGGWASVREVTPEEAEEIKRQLFDENGNRIAPV